MPRPAGGTRRAVGPPPADQGRPAAPAFPQRAMLIMLAASSPPPASPRRPGRIVADTKLDLLRRSAAIHVPALCICGTPRRRSDRSRTRRSVTCSRWGRSSRQRRGRACRPGSPSVCGWPAAVAGGVGNGAAGRAPCASGRRLAWVLGGLAYGLSPVLRRPARLQLGGAARRARWSPGRCCRLIAAARGGSRRRRAAGRSGLAVLAMGGVNAACTLAVLPLPALYILTRERSRARTSLLRWWALAVGLACVWWAARPRLPGALGVRLHSLHRDRRHYPVDDLGVRGRCAEPATGSPICDLGHPWLPAGWSLATAPARRSLQPRSPQPALRGSPSRALPERRFLVAAFALGVVCVGAGYVGPAAGVAGARGAGAAVGARWAACATPTSSSRWSACPWRWG